MMWSEHFLSREIRGKAKRRQHLDEAFNHLSDDLTTNQCFVCHNCHYQDFVSDDATYYYAVFADFSHAEPAGFDCPNCGGPMVAQY